jgi:hypothetical protein
MLLLMVRKFWRESRTSEKYALAWLDDRFGRAGISVGKALLKLNVFPEELLL